MQKIDRGSKGLVGLKAKGGIKEESSTVVLNQSSDRVKLACLRSCGALGSSASFNPLPLADTSLEVWSDGGNLLACGHHGTSHLVTVRIHWTAVSLSF